MNKVSYYLSQYFNGNDAHRYPGLLKRIEPGENLNLDITRATSVVFYDPGNEPRSIDWRNL
jgi:hypothetical protein